MFGYISVLVCCCTESTVTDVTKIDSLALSLLIGMLESSIVRSVGLITLHRYIALANNKDGTGPLASYFKGEVLHGHDTDIFTSNMCTFPVFGYFPASLIFECRSCRRCMHASLLPGDKLRVLRSFHSAFFVLSS